MKPRTKARGLALQALFEIDLTDHPVDVVIKQQLDRHDLEKRYLDFARELVQGVYPLREAMDVYIAEHAPEWPIDQISTIDRNLVRIALWEFAISQITPVKVAINEAVELAKMYGSDSAPRFVNGVLGSLAKRQNEIHLAMLSKLETLEADSKASG